MYVVFFIFMSKGNSTVLIVNLLHYFST